ncbi:MAG: BlaI/MecI/CopY family transcriptional regulator [Alistipes sp.]|nr:BlaI/MecI/CopY family transcriptional regulator [Alistipes sp.]
MEKLTKREEELMRIFWERGPLFVRELVEMADEPKPHFNTLSTMVRMLEAKGYLAHEAFGNTYRYYPVVSQKEFGRGSLSGIIGRYFGNSYTGAVSALVEEEKISLDELRELISRIENADK